MVVDDCSNCEGSGLIERRTIYYTDEDSSRSSLKGLSWAYILANDDCNVTGSLMYSLVEPATCPSKY